MIKKPKQNKKTWAFNVVITLGVCIAVIGAVVWQINFFDIYSDASQTCPSCTSMTKFDQQAHNRDVGQTVFVVGIAVAGSGIFLKSRAKIN